MADIDLAAIIGRAIRHEQDFRAAFGERLAYTEIAPDIFADRNADAHAAEIHGSRHRALVEDALLIELAVIRQVDLVAHRNHLAAVEHGDGIVAARLVLARKSDDDARSAIGGVCREAFDRRPASADEGRLQNQIFRWVTGDEKLGHHQEMRALPRRIGARLTHLGKVSGDIAHRGVQLGDGDVEGLGESVFLCHVIHLIRPFVHRNKPLQKP